MCCVELIVDRYVLDLIGPVFLDCHQMPINSVNGREARSQTPDDLVTTARNNIGDDAQDEHRYLGPTYCWRYQREAGKLQQVRVVRWLTEPKWPVCFLG